MLADTDAEPRVAVVIPCFNDGHFLLETLESVRDQEECETVIVNDGSTDGRTLDILADLQESGIRVITQSNQGLSAARMTGVRNTSARYVQPLDSDDRLAPGALKRLADVLDAQPEADLAWGDYSCFGAFTGRVPGARLLDPWRITYVNEVVVASMIRRSALTSVGGWDMGSGFEDWDLWMKLAEIGAQGVHVPAVTLHYRQHATPRMYRESLGRIEALNAQLRTRRHRLFAERTSNWRRSPSSWGVKAMFPVVGSMPGLPERRRQQCYALIRDIFEPEMSSETFWGPRARLRRWRRRPMAEVVG
ncbi:glycosyltransferase family A protein [Actinoplanes sp. NPDC026670]|uniref:glycosyltransferase family 2 protein n=1 Tax=Actinoplanes sp. NPDC026670 TaxID=3154700 RepID=UPI0033DED507